MKSIKEIYRRYRSILLYIIYGICTTIVNIVCYYICSSQLNLSTVCSTIIAWIAAILFAFITNRKYVFRSSGYTFEKILIEFIKFLVSRVITGIIDIIGMYILVDILLFSGLISKAMINVLVIILNYIFSKKVVFKS